MQQKILYKVADIFDTPVAENETLDDLIERMNKQGRFDFAKMQAMIVLLLKEVEQK